MFIAPALLSKLHSGAKYNMGLSLIWEAENLSRKAFPCDCLCSSFDVLNWPNNRWNEQIAANVPDTRNKNTDTDATVARCCWQIADTERCRGPRKPSFPLTNSCSCSRRWRRRARRASTGSLEWESGSKSWYWLNGWTKWTVGDSLEER